jgi:hypothetical protein
MAESGPNLVVTGRLRELSGQLLFGQPYPLHVEATDRGRMGHHPARTTAVTQLAVYVDGEIADTKAQRDLAKARRLALHFDFSVHASALSPGPHTIGVTASDAGGAVASLEWPVVKSTYTDRTEAEILEDSIEFRTDFGLNTDTAYIDQIMHDPALESNWEFYGVPLTTAELAAVDALNSDSSEPWGQLVADDPAAPLRQSRPAPSRRDPIERYGSDEAADAYAGKYIAHGQIRVGFTRDAASHVARLRQQTGKPLVPFKARYSLRYLQELHKQIVDDWRELESSGIDVTRVGVDIPDNVVRVGTKAPLTDAQRQHLLDRYGPAIRLITSDGLQLLADRWDRHNRP